MAKNTRAIVNSDQRSRARIKLARSMLVVAAAISVLNGCTSVMPNRETQPLDANEAALPSIKKPWLGLGDAPIDFIDTENTTDLQIQDVADSDPLPDYKVRGFSYSGAALYDVIRSLVSIGNVDISLSFDIAKDRPGLVRNTISAYNVKGTFASVLDNLSKTSGFFYRYKNGVLSITSHKQFVVSLPPVSELIESIPKVVSNLGGTEVLVDRSARIVTFMANNIAKQKIDDYLSFLRKNRSLITYDCYIWEVVLNDQSQMGINWRQFPASTAASATASGAVATFGGNSGATAAVNLTSGSFAGSTGLGLVLNSANFKLNALFDFLKTQGTVNNISQPKISLLSGTAASFRNGTNIQYISKVAPGAVTNGTYIPGSAETNTLQTGLNMTIAGDISDGTVFSDISIKMSDLVSMEKQQVAISAGGSTTISLPTSADREVNARVRARPGDAMIVGGINLQRVSNAYNGFGPIPVSAEKTATRSELIVILIPRITNFVSRKMNSEITQ